MPPKQSKQPRRSLNKRVAKLLKDHPIINPVVTGILGAIIGGVLTALILQQLSRPESTAIIEDLVGREAELAVRSPKKPDEYAALFADNAWIVDVGGNQVFQGRTEIVDRYANLPRFVLLEHQLMANPVILSNATAVVVATTLFSQDDGVRRTGNEQWSFAREDGQWKIRSLAYNIPPR